MKNRASAVLILAVGFVLQPTSADARRMEKVLLECDSASPYPAYADCIKTRYSKEGNQKRSGDVHAFYALLDEISEAYRKSQTSAEPMSETTAKANVYRAWQSTIDASNQHETGKVCAMDGNILKCQ